MQESLATEHSSELLADALEQLLDGSAVADERGRHLEAAWWDITDGSLDVVWDPLDKVRAVLVLHIEHLFVDLLHGHASTEHGSDGEVATVARIASSHHVFGIEHLLGELRDGESPVLLRATAGEGRKTRHEEVESGEGNHVDGKLAKISVELAREAKTGGYAAHGSGDEMVQVSVSGGGEFECAEADVVQCFVVDAVSLVGVLYKLVDREGGVVRFDDGV